VDAIALSTFGWVVVGVAQRKVHSFLGYFILSLFFFPLALLTAYLVHDDRGMAPS
jgi:hypothetical protein